MIKENKFFVYILTDKPNGVLYIGVTNNLIRRIEEHKSGSVKGFTKKYNVKHLVYYEIFGVVGVAIYREKQLKNWHRSWKINLIEEFNKNWEDLYYKLQ